MHRASYSINKTWVCLSMHRSICKGWRKNICGCRKANILCFNTVFQATCWVFHNRHSHLILKTNFQNVCIITKLFRTSHWLPIIHRMTGHTCNDGNTIHYALEGYKMHLQKPCQSHLRPSSFFFLPNHTPFPPSPFIPSHLFFLGLTILSQEVINSIQAWEFLFVFWIVFFFLCLAPLVPSHSHIADSKMPSSFIQNLVPVTPCRLTSCELLYSKTHHWVLIYCHIPFYSALE